MMHRQAAPEGRGQRAAAAGFSRAHNTEAIARAKGAGTGAGTGGKSNLAGQIIPVYGFGILLYILYILFKVKHWRLSTQPLNDDDDREGVKSTHKKYLHCRKDQTKFL